MDFLGIYEELKSSIIAYVFGIISLFMVVRIHYFEIVAKLQFIHIRFGLWLFYFMDYYIQRYYFIEYIIIY